ncbi:putative DNA repair protein MutK [Arcanobacterium pluranimalium]|uniref:DUF808 domain-containing protein n=1 Tax=Arcanobacterium pluranimalium TaxID=108028 RepID=UPI0019563160|nr:DUF808 domain-containing protein [Arcanobacterium pluranimalium]MBM7824408.1 putative DNA repair protein MutK [Arcanobacterium pluranimalium]
MAGGLAALLDDVAAIAKLAAASVDDVAAAAGKASVKAVGVVVDDAAVTPQYVRGLSPKRELPIIWRIAQGSIVNKLIIICLALAMNQWTPWLLTPLLMLGGTYLCFEGSEKVIEHFTSHDQEQEKPAVDQGKDAEKAVIRGAIRTDFILSAEIIVIALNEVKDETFGLLLGALIITAILITAGVYGAVAVLVKMDDLGVGLMSRKRASDVGKRIGAGLVNAMPKVMAFISVVGTLAMMWVGGHLFIQGLADLGWSPIYDAVHSASHSLESLPGIGRFLSWTANTVLSMIFGFIWGSVFAVPVMAVHKRHSS